MESEVEIKDTPEVTRNAKWLVLLIVLGLIIFGLVFVVIAWLVGWFNFI